jgi:hypothetical protein
VLSSSKIGLDSVSSSLSILRPSLRFAYHYDYDYDYDLLTISSAIGADEIDNVEIIHVSF